MPLSNVRLTVYCYFIHWAVYIIQQAKNRIVFNDYTHHNTNYYWQYLQMDAFIYNILFMDGRLCIFNNLCHYLDIILCIVQIT